MKAVIALVYIVMAVWLLLAAAIRIALELGSGTALDPLPFISGGLGLLALIALLPGYEEWRERRRSAAELGDDRHPSA